MSVWDSYFRSSTPDASAQRDNILAREKRTLRQKMPQSLSFHRGVIIDGQQRDLSIINSDNLDTKTLLSLPDEDLPHGGLVEWMNNRWLIIEKDANNEVYTRCKMRQCNYLLRWVNQSGMIVERWCIIEDGTKYLTGEYGDNHFILTRGDSRISMIIARDSETIQLERDNRFLIDDYESHTPLAYRLTKPFKMGGSYNENGVLSFVLAECNAEDDDNFDLHIADYYKYFPRPENETPVLPPDDEEEITGKKVWF